jgi:hypothetical protein
LRVVGVLDFKKVVGDQVQEFDEVMFLADVNEKTTKASSSRRAAHGFGSWLPVA